MAWPLEWWGATPLALSGRPLGNLNEADPLGQLFFFCNPMIKHS